MIKFLVGLLFVVLLIAYAKAPFAEPMAQAVVGGVTIVLTNEPCAIKEVSNLPYRATWTAANGEKFEGCFSVFGQSVVAFYFTDKSVAVAPVQVFKKISGV